MFKIIVISLATLAIAQIDAVLIVEDINGNQYYLTSIEAQPLVLHRQRRHHGEDHHEQGPRRETTYDFGNRHAGLGQKVTIVDNDRHKFSASAYGSRDFAPKGPLTTGQGIEYQHKSSNSNFQLNTENTRGQGNDLRASGTYNFFQTQDKRGRVGIGGEYERHYGGPGGTGSPNYNVMLKGSYDLP